MLREGRCLVVQNLTSSQLAGVASALIAAESASRPAISAAYEPSQAVCEAIEALEADRERLYGLQLQAEVLQPLNVDLRLSGEPCLQTADYLCLFIRTCCCQWQTDRAFRTCSCICPMWSSACQVRHLLMLLLISGLCKSSWRRLQGTCAPAGL